MMIGVTCRYYRINLSSSHEGQVDSEYLCDVIDFSIYSNISMISSISYKLVQRKLKVPR